MTKILIVEDESRLARLMALELEHAGFQPDTLSTGREALTWVQEGRCDCLVLDVMLPDLSGLEVCRRIRQTSNIPIIMVTARGQVPDKVAGLELGADDYMVKPVNTEELSARIRAVARRHQGGRTDGSAVHQVGNVALWPAEHRVTVSDNVLPLTPLEFRLLERFLSEVDRVQSRSALLDAVWGIDFIGDTNLVDVTVGRLRRRLQAVHADAQVETVRSVGYVLRERWR